MMANTTNLTLPLIAGNQDQKHVTHNDALNRLDAVVQMSVKDRDLTAPPGSPSDGDRYIPAAGATGAWSGWDLSIAAYQNGAWVRYIPKEGWVCWIDDESLLLIWNGTAWINNKTNIIGTQYIPTAVDELWWGSPSRLATPRTYIISAVSGATITLTTANVQDFFNTQMQNNAMVRLWNITKVPAESCWVDWNNSTTQFRVQNAADISGWLATETLQLGDPNPTGTNTLQMVAIDISNFLLNKIGGVFRQKAVHCYIAPSAVGGWGSCGLSPTGASGSAFDMYSLSNGQLAGSAINAPCSELSPISNSNLVFLRENLGGGATGLTTTFIRILGVFV